MIRTDELADVIDSVSGQYGYDFCAAEISWVLGLTERKCMIKGKGDEYMPLLFETELKEYLTGEAINHHWRKTHAGNYHTGFVGAGVC